MADDEPNILSIAGNELKAAGYDVFTAPNGREAVSKAIEINPDLILLDRNMPVMDGLEACKKMREVEMLKKTPMIFLTAQNTDKERIEGLVGGANDYLTKPFNMNELLERVKSALSAKR